MRIHALASQGVRGVGGGRGRKVRVVRRRRDSCSYRLAVLADRQAQPSQPSSRLPAAASPNARAARNLAPSSARQLHIRTPHRPPPALARYTSTIRSNYTTWTNLVRSRLSNNGWPYRCSRPRRPPHTRPPCPPALPLLRDRPRRKHVVLRMDPEPRCSSDADRSHS